MTYWSCWLAGMPWCGWQGCPGMAIWLVCWTGRYLGHPGHACWPAQQARLLWLTGWTGLATWAAWSGWLTSLSMVACLACLTRLVGWPNWAGLHTLLGKLVGMGGQAGLLTVLGLPRLAMVSWLAILTWLAICTWVAWLLYKPGYARPSHRACAPQAMTGTETRCAQTDKELLAVVFGCEGFRHFIHNKLQLKHLKPPTTITHEPLDNKLWRMLDLMFSWKVLSSGM
jgi:hypothetical protein